MKFAIIGTGAIGGYYGAMLCKANQEVHFLLNSDFEHVKENGLLVDSDLHGKIEISEVNAHQKASNMPVCDIVFVCLKSMQNEKLLPQILPSITDENSIIILIQNGLGVEEDVATLFPNLQIAGCVAFIASNKIGNGHIHHLEHGSLKIGGHSVKSMSQLESVAKILNEAKIPTEVFPTLDTIRWQKLIWNMAFNGTTVILNTTTDKILAIPETREMVRTLMTETILGAQACGIDLSLDLVEQTIRYTDEMQPYKPSMKLDYDNHRPMEIKYIYQKPIERAAAAGFEMTKMKVIYQQLSFIQAHL